MKSIAYVGAKLWNKFVNVVRNIDSLNALARKFYSF